MTTFVFRVRNVPAALYKALGGFATNGVNMTKLESYMLAGQFVATQFLCDVDGHPEQPPLRRALEELTFFSSEVRVSWASIPAAPFRLTQGAATDRTLTSPLAGLSRKRIKARTRSDAGEGGPPLPAQKQAKTTTPHEPGTSRWTNAMEFAPLHRRGTLRPQAAAIRPAGPSSSPSPPAPPHRPPPPPDTQIPPFARVPYEPISRESVVAIALREWRLFGQPVDDDPPGTRPPPAPDEKPEREPGLWQRVGEYWWLGLNAGAPEAAWTGKHDEPAPSSRPTRTAISPGPPPSSPT